MYNISVFHTFTSVIKFASGANKLFHHLPLKGDMANFIYRSMINSLFLFFLFFGTTANLVIESYLSSVVFENYMLMAAMKRRSSCCWKVKHLPTVDGSIIDVQILFFFSKGTSWKSSNEVAFRWRHISWMRLLSKKKKFFFVEIQIASLQHLSLRRRFSCCE
jgi:hypothetical protein